ncbi:30S ribosomal protein S2 [Candidatus Pinguicoccus supinus]|uniref:Small ribosomal subunit protein uS2 n=1 Tax=Candidatus Pinguicoccus supinus TaxID=2529394 RepID=A0A7T0BRI0_9BACT|nr:30S ribosomal protein S2 [Candidatus Pinguicoccus supinus]
MGGTLTNFLTIQKNLKKFSKLIYLKNRGFLENIDGREKIYLKKKINKLNRKFGGLLNLKKLPSAVIVADCKIDYNAILEAHKLNIPVIGIADSDANIELVTVPILVNVKSRKTIVFLLTLILNLVLKNILK